MKELKELLLKVERPARYVGGEYNMPDMDKPTKARFCLCFPEVYEIGMSNIGMRILYHMLNERPNVVCERCFAPMLDMANILRVEGLPLFSIETQRSLKDFEIVGFSLGYEMLYTNILYMLELAGIPFLASQRGESDPIIIAGGPCAINMEPIADYFDVVLIGEGEINLNIFMDEYLLAQSKGVAKASFLASLVGKEGIYVPAFNGDKKVIKAVVKELDTAYFPTKILVPNIEITHDRAVLEIYRGCSNGCRFCQAGFYYRPIREHSLDTLVKYAKELIENTGYNELSLASLSTSDYSEIMPLIDKLKSEVCKESVRLAMPSLRLDSYKEEYSGIGRMGSLTFAPEAGSQRLRNVINKNISQENIDNTITHALTGGYSGVKLYFMIGLPTETDEDINGIIEMVNHIKQLAFSNKRKSFSITVSASVFIPKPGTPFQWCEQISMTEMKRRQEMLKFALRIKGVKFNWHDATTSQIEAAMAVGDRRLAKVIERAYRLGAKFDGWSEHFKYEIWMKAFEECGVDILEYTSAKSLDKPLAWDYVDIGVTKEYLLKEYKLAMTAEATTACTKKSCKSCGANRLGGCFK